MSNEEQCCPTDVDVNALSVVTNESVIGPSEEEKEFDFLMNKESNSASRLDICKGCPELITPVNMCKQCKCFMNIKVRIYSAACPLGKW
jgi:hypothetical protein